VCKGLGKTSKYHTITSFLGKVQCIDLNCYLVRSSIVDEFSSNSGCNQTDIRIVLPTDWTETLTQTGQIKNNSKAHTKAEENWTTTHKQMNQQQYQPATSTVVGNPCNNSAKRTAFRTNLPIQKQLLRVGQQFTLSKVLKHRSCTSVPLLRCSHSTRPSLRIASALVLSFCTHCSNLMTKNV
jgi:hypothetical protein